MISCLDSGEMYYFTASNGYLIYMGKDKYENEELIKYGFPEDIWFHVDDLSSAHVYLRLRKGETIHDIPKEVLEECAQLVKANSIKGNKLNQVKIIYTPWSNLLKTKGMEAGQVGYKKDKKVYKTKVETRINAIVNRLMKTKQEVHPDLSQLHMERMKEESRAEKEKKRAAEKARKQAMEEAAERKKLESFADLFDIEDEAFTSNKGNADLEDDFM